MATIPRTYQITSSDNLDNVDKINGQVIALWDTDAVYYDAPEDGSASGNPVRRKMSGVEVIHSLVPFIERAGGNPDDPYYKAIVPMNDIIYVYIPTNQSEQTILPSSDPAQPLYDLRVWIGDATTGNWEIVGTNRDDINVKTELASIGDKFYLTGAVSDGDDISTLLKFPSVYASIVEGSGSTIKSKIHADIFEGSIENATHAEEADIATNAINDKNGEDLTGYIFTVGSEDVPAPNSGTRLLFKDGTGTTKITIDTKDTTYKVFTTDANKPGLVNGIGTTVGTDSTNLLLSGSGWINKSDITMPSAESAIRDGRNQVITDTYIAGASYNTTTHDLILTDGRNPAQAKVTVNIPDTTYNDFSVGNHGLVPAPTSADSLKFLRGDAHWESLPVFAGSDAGLVPTANPATDAGKYLKGDGTWGGVFAGSGTPGGLVPAVGSGDVDKYLKSDGTWADSDGAYKTGSSQDTSKLFVVGAKSQTAGTNGIQTYSNSNVYINGGKLYQNSDLTSRDTFIGDGILTTFPLAVAGATAITEVSINGTVVSSGYSLDTGTNSIVFTTAPADADEIEVTYAIPYSAVQVVDVASSQEITNKKFIIEGDAYALGTACSHHASSAMYPQVSENFTGDGTRTTFALAHEVIEMVSVTVNEIELPETDYTVDTTQEPNTVQFNTAPALDDDIVIDYTVYYADNIPTCDAVSSFVTNQIDAIANIAEDKIDNSVLAPAYDETSHYVVGNFCMYQNTGDDYVKLYLCTTNTLNPAGNFDSGCWTAKTIIEAIQYLINPS